MNILKNKLGYNYNDKGDLFRIDLIKPGNNYEDKTIQEKEYKEDNIEDVDKSNNNTYNFTL